MAFSNLERVLPNDLSKKPVARVVTIFFPHSKVVVILAKAI